MVNSKITTDLKQVEYAALSNVRILLVLQTHSVYKVSNWVLKEKIQFRLFSQSLKWNSSNQLPSWENHNCPKTVLAEHYNEAHSNQINRSLIYYYKAN